MARSTLAAAALAALTFLAATVRAQDVRWSEQHAFTLTDRGATEEVTVSVEFLTARGTEHTVYGVGEQFFNRVDRFSAQLDGRRINGRHISEEKNLSGDVFLSGGTVHRLELPEKPSVGQTLVYKYRRTYPDIAYLPILYVPSGNDVGEYVVTVKHPRAMTVSFSEAHPRGPVPKEVEQTDEALRIAYSNLGDAEDLPLFDHNGYHVAVQLDVRQGQNVLTPIEPDAFAAWYAGLLGPTPPAPSPALLEIARGLERDNPAATIAAIHDYVRKGVRYIADERGEGAFIPRVPDLVIDRMYGDCKDRALLVASLASALNLRVDLVLIRTADEAPATGVSLGLYNHMINAFGPENDRTFFDPTHPYLAYGDLPDSDADGRALVLGETGAADVVVAAQDSLPTLDVVVRLHLDRADEGAATIAVRGDLIGPVRQAMERGTSNDVLNSVSYLAGERMSRVRLHGLELVEDTPHEITFRGTADLSEFVIASPTRRYLPLTPLRSVPAEASERLTDDFSLSLPERANSRLRLILEGSEWQAAPLSERWGDDIASFEASVEPSEIDTVVAYQFRQLTRRFSGSQRTAYLDLAMRYLGARREVITFNASAQ